MLGRKDPRTWPGERGPFSTIHHPAKAPALGQMGREKPPPVGRRPRGAGTEGYLRRRRRRRRQSANRDNSSQLPEGPPGGRNRSQTLNFDSSAPSEEYARRYSPTV